MSDVVGSNGETYMSEKLEATGGREQEYDIMDSQELSYTIVSELVATYGFAEDPEAWQANAAIKKAIYAATAPLLAELTRVSAERDDQIDYANIAHAACAEWSDKYQVASACARLEKARAEATESELARLKQAGNELLSSTALLLAASHMSEDVGEPARKAVAKTIDEWQRSASLTGAVAALPPTEAK
jgi:hypothetical protein